MVRLLATSALGLLVVLALPAVAMAHSERPTFFPDGRGTFPEYRTMGPQRVVCAADSKQRIAAWPASQVKKANQKLLRACSYSDIQAAIDDASSLDRIAILPGVYRELPSRAKPDIDPACEDMWVDNEAGVSVPSYEYQLHCPNAQNLIAIAGDTDGDRKCDQKCNLQIEGTGRTPDDVMIEGDRSKLNLIRADRADGIFLKNFTVEFSDFNNVYVLETDGFRVDSVVSSWSREYGILSFTSDHGIYENCETFGNGDSGVYPGSGPDLHGSRYGIIIRNCDSHDNTIGYSGTAGNGIWAHDNRFHDNAAGLTTDSFAPGHPGMPQDASKWSRNQIYSNNKDLFNDERDAYCKQPIEQRDPHTVCPTFQVPVGTGLLIAGGNDNVIEDNYIYDNWRNGTTLFWVPATLRGEQDPTKLYDTSFNNRYVGNRMGVRPDGTRDPNGMDFWWDGEEGIDEETLRGNCWSGNVGPGGNEPTSDPPRMLLPGCPGLDLFRPGDSTKQATLIPCATWDPMTNTDPPGCDWFTRPPEPQ